MIHPKPISGFGGAVLAVEIAQTTTIHPKKPVHSRLPGFYEKPVSERIRITKNLAALDEEEVAALSNRAALNDDLIDAFIENGIGTFALPIGIATNFVINGRSVLIPMAVEETSVIAAA